MFMANEKEKYNKTKKTFIFLWNSMLNTLFKFLIVGTN